MHDRGRAANAVTKTMQSLSNTSQDKHASDDNGAGKPRELRIPPLDDGQNGVVIMAIAQIVAGITLVQVPVWS